MATPTESFLGWLRGRLRAWLGLAPRKPGSLTLRDVRRLTVLRVTINLPTATASDLGTREFHATVNGTPQPDQALPAAATEAAFDCDANAACEVWLVDVDTSGNRSEESEHLAFVAADVFAPGKPGELGVKEITQI